MPVNALVRAALQLDLVVNAGPQLVEELPTLVSEGKPSEHDGRRLQAHANRYLRNRTPRGVLDGTLQGDEVHIGRQRHGRNLRSRAWPHDDRAATTGPPIRSKVQGPDLRASALHPSGIDAEDIRAWFEVDQLEPTVGFCLLPRITHEHCVRGFGSGSVCILRHT